MTSEAWVNFSTAEGVIVGLVTIPTTIPHWFKTEAELIRGSSRKELESDREVMETLTVREWVDELCSRNRPIPVRYPLSPQQQEEFVLIPNDELQTLMEDMKKAAMESKNPQVEFSDENLRKLYGVKFMEDKSEDSKRTTRVPRTHVQPWMEGTARVFIVHVPMLEEEREDIKTFRVHPGRLNGSTLTKPPHNWDAIVQHAYPNRITPVPAGAISVVG